MESGIADELRAAIPALALGWRLDIPLGFESVDTVYGEKDPTRSAALVTRPDGIVECVLEARGPKESTEVVVAKLERLFARDA